VLKGITRQMVLAACQNQGYRVVEKEISLEETLNMDAIFISSTSPKVLPVSQVDDKIINSGNNKVIQDIMAGYDAIIDDYVKSHK
jgi:branched-chain amino acid aminotransferase